MQEAHGIERFHFSCINELEETHWWYAARRELIVGLAVGYRILDVGCGTGTVLVALAQKCGEAVGVDSSAVVKLTGDRVRRMRLANVGIARADGLKLCFLDGLFDMVVCADVVEHVEDEYSFLREMRRVLKPSGLILITAPASKRLWSRMDEEAGHRRRYDPSSMKSLLSGSGFADIKIRYWNSVLFPLILVIRKLLNPGFTKELVTGSRFNSLLYQLLRYEEMVRLPFGTSLLAVARRA